MTAEHRARMLEHQTRIKATLEAHGEGNWMSPKTTSGTPNGTDIAEPVAAGSQPEQASTPGSASTAGMEMVLLQSASIGQLALALSKAQGEIKAPGKGRTAKITGGKADYSYKYADLADVIEAYRPALSKHGLALVQPLLQRDGHLVLVTRLIHGSGEWMQSEYPLTVYQRPQEQGSAITYARRYTVSSLLGIAAEDDDDGQRAQDAQPQRRQEPEAPAAPPSGDAAAILDLAAELEQFTGKNIPDIIDAASYFKTDEGAERRFSDPTKIASQKWLKKVRATLERDLQGHQSTAALGDGAIPF